MALEIVLDTETTGFDPKTGHRLIEIGCIEVEDLIPTGRSFHEYINPQREIPADAIRVHGITDAMVADKPLFSAIAPKLIEFIGDRPIVAHNADFDRSFVNFELEREGLPIFPESQWIDTLKIAKQKFPGLSNSLDALCKRFDVSLAGREKHGALLDAHLLTQVYLELLGGKERALDLQMVRKEQSIAMTTSGYGPRPRPLESRITVKEKEAHAAFVAKYLKDKSLWIS